VVPRAPETSRTKEPPIAHPRRQLVASLAAAALVLVACGEDDPVIEPEPDTTEDTADGDDPIDADADAPDADDGDDADAEETDDPDETDAEDPEPLDGEASTEDRRRTARPRWSASPTSASPATTASTASCSRSGATARPVGACSTRTRPADQGKGTRSRWPATPCSRSACATSRCPSTRPTTSRPTTGPERLEGPGDGPILEIVEDTIFEGQHVFFVGLDEERPFRIARLDDPQRVVIDVVSDTDG
jgi:hypothetical protein